VVIPKHGTSDFLAQVVVWECGAASYKWHYNSDEAYIVISGERFMTDESGEERRFSAGDVAFPLPALLRKVDNGAPSSVASEGTDQLRARLKTLTGPKTYFCQVSKLFNSTVWKEGSTRSLSMGQEKCGSFTTPCTSKVHCADAPRSPSAGVGAVSSPIGARFGFAGPPTTLEPEFEHTINPVPGDLSASEPLQLIARKWLTVMGAHDLLERVSRFLSQMSRRRKLCGR
jgi:hypothetical protein